MVFPKPGAGAPANVRLRLFALGFQVLFLELLLIRFLAGHIWNLGYFPNLVLLAAFIGFGFGFLLHGRVSGLWSPRLYVAMPPLLLAFILLVFWLKPAGFVGFGGGMGLLDGELFFTIGNQSRDADPLPLELGKFAAWFLGVVGIFFLIGQRMAKLFRELPPLQAYSLDISGSLAGILLFMLFSHLELSASVWFIAFGVSFWVAARGDAAPAVRIFASSAAVLLALVSLALDNPELSGHRWGANPHVLEAREQYEQGNLAARETLVQSSKWSPYQRLTLLEMKGVGGSILANGIDHQSFGFTNASQLSMYRLAHSARAQAGGSQFQDVLVIGSGAGNDVSEALFHGAQRIEAVEIDPGILEYGYRERAGTAPPYYDHRVMVVVDDGRHHLLNTERKYDLIVFALTDSLVKVSSVSQLRLENYLFTLNSFRRAGELLKPDGWLVLYNFYRERWLVEKFERMLQESLPKGYAVEVFHLDGLSAAVLLGRPLEGGAVPAADAGALDSGVAYEPATDDWPFPYMQARSIPIHYLVAMGVVIGLVFAALLAFGRRTQRSDPRLAVSFTLLGAAFLLLETKGVIQFSLLFGTTWLNNSLVFFAVLVSVLLAIRVAAAVRSPRLLPAAALLLFVSAGVSLAVPLDALLAYDPFMRFVLAGALMFTPVFMANLIFSVLFRDRQDAELYFGWNLLGATVGGVLEYISIATGYQALGVVVIALYAVALAAAWLAMRREAEAPAPPGSGPRKPWPDRKGRGGGT